MPDWKKSMQQTFEYYIVDPGTWRDVKQINTVKSSTINRDLETDTLGSATIDVTNVLGESYVRTYLITIQNGIREKHPLGTYLVQTPSSNHDGKVRNVSMDAYTPLLELKENPPPIGYSIFKGSNVMDNAYQIVSDHVRAPVVRASTNDKLYKDFVANTDDTWITFTRDLISNAKKEFALDELGRILFAPIQDIKTLQPVWEYDDSNSSILYSEVTIDHDLFDVPNVVEVIYSSGNTTYYSRVVNDDENSPVSTIRRGREKLHRVINPEIPSMPSQEQIDLYAKDLLKALSKVEYKIKYTHAYCPVRLGDCVRLTYAKAELNGVKARVISQSIKCEPGCPVTETALCTVELWG